MREKCIGYVYIQKLFFEFILQFVFKKKNMTPLKKIQGDQLKMAVIFWYPKIITWLV